MVEEQQTKLRERSSNFYTKTVLCNNFFNTNNRVNCLVPTDGGRKLIYGTDNGIYIADRWPKEKSIKPRRILDATQVSQIDTLEEYRLLLVLSNKSLTSYPFEALEANNQNALAVRPRKIQGHANFFKAGIAQGRHLVCSVKTSALSTTIKVYEPMDDLAKGKKKQAISKMFTNTQDALKLFKVSVISIKPLCLLTFTRNSTFPPNLPPCIIFAPPFVSAALAASKSFLLKQPSDNLYWTKQTRRSTLSRARKMSNPSTLSG